MKSLIGPFWQTKQTAANERVLLPFILLSSLEHRELRLYPLNAVTRKATPFPRNHPIPNQDGQIQPRPQTQNAVLCRPEQTKGTSQLPSMNSPNLTRKMPMLCNHPSPDRLPLCHHQNNRTDSLPIALPTPSQLFSSLTPPGPLDSALPIPSRRITHN